MPKDTVGDFIRSVFSTLVNEDDDIFEALFANPDETGVVEKIFNDIETARDVWCNNSDVYCQSGEILEKSVSFFSVFKRLFMESDESLKKRNELIFYRNGDTVWGDKWNILNIFKAYFETEFIYTVNNTDDLNKNLLIDGDFEAKNVWALENCAYDRDARFSGRNGVFFNSCGICKQTVAVQPDSTYFLHFFVSGVIDVEIRDNNGRYWNPKIGEFGGWNITPCLNQFSADGWDAKNIFFLTDETVESVTVKFAGRDGNTAYLDYVRLFKKENYPSFTLIVRLNGRYTEDTMAFAPGTDDPVKRRDYTGFGYFSGGAPENDAYIEGGEALAPWDDDKQGHDIDYSIMSYIGQSHLFGAEGAKAESVYTELLEIVRAGGIASCIEILIRDLDE